MEVVFPMRRIALAAAGAALIFALALTPAAARFTGPQARGQDMTVAAAQNARTDTYIVLTGNIVSHLRENYYVFRDATGEIRLEIPPGAWSGNDVSPETRVRVLGEVDRNWSGLVYIWVMQVDIAG